MARTFIAEMEGIPFELKIVLVPRPGQRIPSEPALSGAQCDERTQHMAKPCHSSTQQARDPPEVKDEPPEGLNPVQGSHR